MSQDRAALETGAAIIPIETGVGRIQGVATRPSGPSPRDGACKADAFGPEEELQRVYDVKLQPVNGSLGIQLKKSKTGSLVVVGFTPDSPQLETQIALMDELIAANGLSLHGMKKNDVIQVLRQMTSSRSPLDSPTLILRFRSPA